MNIDFGDVKGMHVDTTGTLFYGGGKRKTTNVAVSIEFNKRGSVYINLDRAKATKLAKDLLKHLNKR